MVAKFITFVCTILILLNQSAAFADGRNIIWRFNNKTKITEIESSSAKISVSAGESSEQHALQVCFQTDTFWPSVAFNLKSAEDWSSYSYLSIKILNTEVKAVSVGFAIRDAFGKIYKPVRVLSPKKWLEIKLPIKAMSLGTDMGWSGEAVNIKQIDNITFFLHKPKKQVNIRLAEIMLVRLKSLSAPALSAKGAGDGVSLSWTTIKGAVAYDIFRTDQKGKERFLSRFPVSRFVDTTAIAGIAYKYRVAGVDNMMTTGKKSQPATAHRNAKAPASLPPLDRFGGRTDITLNSTGFSHTEKYKGRWTLVSPEGHPFFSIGIDVVGVGDTFSCISKRKDQFSDVISEKNDPKFAAAWKPWYGYGPYGQNCSDLIFSQYVRNQIIKYGVNWMSIWKETTIHRLKKWRINTFGAWSHDGTIRQGKMPYVAFGADWSDCPLIPGIRLPDVFDPAFEKNVTESVKMIAKKKYDPYLIGRFTGNELAWFGDWQNGKTVVDLIQEAPASLAAKKAWIQFLKVKYVGINKLNKTWETDFASFENLLAMRDKVPSSPIALNDAERFLEFFADRYFRITTEALKRYDPNHLILGVRYAGYAPKQVIHANGRYCDILSINIYGMLPVFERFQKFGEFTDKPWIIGEFSFGAKDSGLPDRQSGLMLSNQAERGKAYQRYVSEALAIPSIVGVHWFQYIDQPATGRYDGEDYNSGWVDVNDQPYKEFVQRASLINANIPLIYDY